MKEKIFKNFSLKILSIVFAVVIWTVIVNIYDPNTTYTFSNIPVQLINTESLTNENYTYEIVDGEKISVQVSGPKSVVTDLKTSDIVATADLSQISAFADYVDIDVRVVKNGQLLSDIEATPKTSAVRLNIENRDTKDFNIEVQLTGNAADGYTVLNTSCSPASVKITGSESAVAQINSVKATVDISNAVSSTTQQSQLYLYDAQGNEIASDGLQMSAQYADVTVDIGGVKEIPITVHHSGEVAAGYIFDGLELNYNTVAVTGKAEALPGLEKVEIPAEDVDVSGLAANKIFRFNLSDYLPNGVTIVSEGQLEVTAKVMPELSRTISLNAAAIKMTGLGAGYKAAISESAVNIVFMGSREDLNAININNVSASVNLAGLTEGRHTVRLTVSNPQGCTVSGVYNVTVVIAEAESQKPTTTQPQPSSEQQTTQPSNITQSTSAQTASTAPAAN